MSKPEVAIVGIGIHPFGRTPDKTGQEQGVYAVREALKDAGVEWKDIQFAFGGSQAAGAMTLWFQNWGSLVSNS